MSAELHSAIRAHDLDTLARLLAAGDDPNELHGEWSPWSPLHTAVDELEDGGDIEALALLLRHGANCNLWDARHYSTPLLQALFCGQREAALTLLAAGADPNVRGGEGDMPLAWCAKEGDLNMVATLLRAGAALTIDHSTGLECMTALGHAAARLDIEMIKLLLAWGASVDALDADYMVARKYLPERTEENAEKVDLALKMLSPKS